MDGKNEVDEQLYDAPLASNDDEKAFNAGNEVELLTSTSRPIENSLKDQEEIDLIN